MTRNLPAFYRVIAPEFSARTNDGKEALRFGRKLRALVLIKFRDGAEAPIADYREDKTK